MSVTASRILSAAMVVVVASLTLGGASAQQSAIPSGGAELGSNSLQQQSGGFGGMIANLPGARTATGILASSADGMSRYFAPDGPIQPALTAIGGLPMRGAEMANRGISRLSEKFDNSAQSLSRSAGNEGNIRMPGMEALESSMPASFAQLGTKMHGAIQQKNKFIMGQAEKGIQAGERLQSMMQQGFGGMGARTQARMGNMMGQAQDVLTRGTEEIKQQVRRSLGAKVGRMHSVMAMGSSMQNHAGGIGRTLSNGLSSTVSTIQRTGDQVRQQLQGSLKQNQKAMEGIMNSMQGSMGNMGQNMQKNLHGVVRHAQNAAEQVSGHLQQAISAPLEMVKSVGSMMHGGASGSGSSKGGRY